jgi:hypothetical protein
VTHESTTDATPSQGKRNRTGIVAVTVVGLIAVAIAALGIWRGVDTDDLAEPTARPAIVPHGLSADSGLPDDDKLSFGLTFDKETKVKVTPLWDSWNNCILDNPFPSSFDGTVTKPNFYGVTLRSTKNSDGICNLEFSRMHWRVESGSLVEEVRLESGQRTGWDTIECIDVGGRAEWDVVCKDGKGYPSIPGMVAKPRT